MQPETGATLKVYNWTAYINQAVVNSFAKKYNCKVQVSTFNTMDEALAKIHSGQVDFDVFMGVTIDVLGPLVEQKFIQPLNHSYIPNITHAWPDFQNPFYDGKWQYTVPVHDLHDRDRLAEGSRAGEPVHDGQAVGHALAAEVQGQGRDPRRLPRGHQPRPDEERHLRPEHHQRRARSRHPGSSCRTWPA